MSNDPLTTDDLCFLRDAAGYLENPTLLMRLANAAGKPLERLAGVVPGKVREVTDAALRRAMALAVYTVRARGADEEKLLAAYQAAGWTGFWHTLLTVATGGAGGAFGLPALAVELPVTTGIMFRSVAAIAGEYGEDLADPGVRLECLSVFSHGSAGPGQEAMESSYLTARTAMAGLVEEAALFVARESADAVAEAMANGTAPALLNFVGRVAARFNVTVSQKVLAVGLPVVGAGLGAVINAAFSDHFNRVARYHFGVRMLERRRGREVVHTAYRAELRELRAASPGRRVLGPGREDLPPPGPDASGAGPPDPGPSAPAP